MSERADEDSSARSALAPICGNCAHTESVATIDGVKVVDCAVCRGATTRRVERRIVERILAERIKKLHGLSEDPLMENSQVTHTCSERHWCLACAAVAKRWLSRESST